MDQALSIPGTTNAWTMPIKARIDMLTHRRAHAGRHQGLRARPRGRSRTSASAWRRSSATCPARAASTPSAWPAGTSSTSTSSARELARYGLTVAQAQDVIMSAVGGENVTHDDRRARALSRERPLSRASCATTSTRLGRVLVMTPTGRPGAARRRSRTSSTVTGPSMIRNENGLLAGYVYVDMAGQRHRRLRGTGQEGGGARR